MAHPKHSFSTILFLSDSISNNAVDKKVLREAGVTQIICMSSGSNACDYLTKNLRQAREMLVVCNAMLDDMSGEQFCNIVRLHPRLLGIPILLVLPSKISKDHLLALGCGASAIIARPYSISAMHDALYSLSYKETHQTLLKNGIEKCSQKTFDESIDDLQYLLQLGEHNPEDFFKVGMRCLNDQKWNSAIAAFHHALSSQIVKGEAELGIATAYKGKGKLFEAEQWMTRACETFVFGSRWQMARMVYARIAKSNAAARNTFFVRARRQIAQGAYDAAAITLVEGIETVPHDEASKKMAEICVSAHAPTKMLHYLTDILEDRNMADSLIADVKTNFSRKIQEANERRLKACEERYEVLSRRFAPTNESLPEPIHTIHSLKNDQDDLRTTATVHNGAFLQTKGVSPSPKLVTQKQVIAKLDFEEKGSRSSSKWNDFLTMIKMTWKLSRSLS
ncbi:MAG: hypothetical protein J5803_05825 [Desulfovibrio sp.]|nr:hypothetical protein [Desulfovibrio sp.]